MNHTINADLLADILSVSKSTLKKWEISGKITSILSDDNTKHYLLSELISFPEINQMYNSEWEEEINIIPHREYSSIELFAGAGGLALGLEYAGFKNLLLNEYDKDACATLRINRPNWQVIENDITKVNFRSSDYHNVDLLSGGFPCQAFSYAGNQLGFADIRGTMFFEFARAVDEIQPKVFIAENVRGLIQHDQGKTIQVIKTVLSDLGYTLIEPKILKAIFYKVPQKRERLFIIGIRNDLTKYATFNWPSFYHKIFVLRDALKAGELYPFDVPYSPGQQYPQRKKEIMNYVPAGGYWRDLPDELQREYMRGSYFLGGGKTGMARRLSWDTPSLTLTCAPAQNQTERCHPEETRPLTVREYARIQTFPDEWSFAGSISSQYKQIGNAVPVNLAAAVGRSLIGLLNSIEQKQSNIEQKYSVTKHKIAEQVEQYAFDVGFTC